MRLRFIIVISILCGCASSRPVARTDLAGWEQLPNRTAQYEAFETRSVLITMRDGTKLAADVYLPQHLKPGTRVPTILRQTRYGRRIVYRFPFAAFLGDPRYGHTRAWFVAHGYAWVDLDVRGTGASDGVWVSPWSDDEVKDGGDVVTWIVQQDWSNGRVGATGISYDGTAAELLLLNKHPAVKAVAPRFAPFDVFADIAFPGGLQLSWLTSTWSRLNDALDHNELSRFFGAGAIVAMGVASVPGEDRPTPQMKLDRAKNNDIHRQASDLTFSDDSPGAAPGYTIGQNSPHSRFEAIKAAGVPMYIETGWSDGACSRSAIHRFLNEAPPGSQLVIGPWEHGGHQNESPFSVERQALFDHDSELLRFFDRYLLGDEPGTAARAAVSWFTVGAETWRTAAQWPPPSEPREYFFGPKRTLNLAAADAGIDEFTLDPTSGAGVSSRWNSLINLTDAPLPPRDQSALDERRLVYTSAPLTAALEVTGHPTVSLVLSADAKDTAVFVWLEDVDEWGRAWIVSEGVLRAVHRKLQPAGPYRTLTPWRSYLRADGQLLEPGMPAQLDIELLPVSWQLQAGHRLRLSLAGAEIDHFAAIPNGATRWTVMLGAMGSRLILPIATGAARAGSPTAP